MSSDTCADCGKGPVDTELTEYEIPYGESPHTVFIECTVPVRVCKACGFKFTDYEAEKIRDDRINEYLYATGQGRPKEWSPLWRVKGKSP